MLFLRLGIPDCSVTGLLPHHRKGRCFRLASHRIHEKTSIRRGKVQASGNTESILTDDLLGDQNAARNGSKLSGDLRDLFRRADINR